MAQDFHQAIWAFNVRIEEIESEHRQKVAKAERQYQARAGTASPFQDASEVLVEGGQEKGVNVSLALDLVQATHEQHYDAAIIVSQDWDFGPAVHLAKMVARAQGRQLVFESAFPFGPGSSSRRGVPGTTWVRIDQATYDACRDSRDYRPRRP